MNVSQIEFHTLHEIDTRWVARANELAAQMEEAIREIAEFIRQALEDLLARLRALWKYIRQALVEFLIRLDRVYEDFQRAEVYTRLRAWRVPHWIAAPISAYWPRRWLPHRLPYLFDKIAQKS